MAALASTTIRKPERATRLTPMALLPFRSQFNGNPINGTRVMVLRNMAA
jgi:hypothetical protein